MTSMRRTSTRRRDDGVIVVLALFLTLLLSALGAALALMTSSEAAIAQNFKNGYEALHAADAAAERALADLDALTDWTPTLTGAIRSTFVDGPASGTRRLPDGTTLDLAQVVNLANCRKKTMCSVSEIETVTSDRPWAANNPRWQLFLSGPLRDISPGRVIDSSLYVVVLVADDPSETDGDPLLDSDPPQSGSHTVLLRALAFGPRGTQRTIELTVTRSGTSHVRVIAWRPY